MKELADAEVVVDARAEWRRLHAEWAREQPAYGTWIGTEFFPVGS